MRHAWIDASAGIAGDMLLGALLDAGADLEVVRQAVHAVVRDAVRVTTSEVTRAGLRATHARVELVDDDPPHRTHQDIDEMIAGAHLTETVRDRARAVFATLAEAEGAVHGIAASDVEFHEVGALDSIADIVAVCSALDDLGVTSLSVGPIQLGSGQVRSAHGTLPVPVPAVLALSRGWTVTGSGSGECTTPTGMAIIAALADHGEPMPTMTVSAVGVGAGTRDAEGRANVTRIVLGERADGPSPTRAIVLEANVDDLDPRLWPGVLSALLAAGADDAWLTPILMKKGRPAHTLSVLCAPEQADVLRTMLFAQTSTLGVRESSWSKTALPRTWQSVTVAGHAVRIKLGHLDGRIVNVAAEFEDVAQAAVTLGRAERDVLDAAMASAANAGLVSGHPLPE